MCTFSSADASALFVDHDRTSRLQKQVSILIIFLLAILVAWGGVGDANEKNRFSVRDFNDVHNQFRG